MSRLRSWAPIFMKEIVWNRKHRKASTRGVPMTFSSAWERYDLMKAFLISGRRPR